MSSTRETEVEVETTREQTRAEKREREKRARNNLRQLREERLLSKAEFARKAGLSALTIDRVENGKPCRMNTKRKIILALGLTIEDKDQVFDPNADTDVEGEAS